MIVADDMGYGDFGVFNDGKVKTPTLDRLVSESLCLSQHYAGSASCSPSRAALLTGRYSHRTGALVPNEVMGLDRISIRETTIADAFKSGGYATGCVGKMFCQSFKAKRRVKPLADSGNSVSFHHLLAIATQPCATVPGNS